MPVGTAVATSLRGVAALGPAACVPHPLPCSDSAGTLPVSFPFTPTSPQR